MRALTLTLGLASCASTHVGDAGVACRWSDPSTPSLGGCGALASTPPCSDWAARLATNGTAAIARCAHDASDAGAGELGFRCASADRCDGVVCWCGREPECASGSACMIVAGEPRCVGCER